MKLLRLEHLRRLLELLRETAPEPDEMALRLRTIERDIILPVKLLLLLILVHNFYFSRWFEDVALPTSVAQVIVERFFLIFLIFNVGVAFVLVCARWFRSGLVQRVIFTSNFLDGLFLAALTFVTGGFDSILYWLFLGLIVRNAVSSPLAVPQLILNLSVSICYLVAGLLDVAISDEMLDFEPTMTELVNPTEPMLLRLIVLWLMTACCYGVQVLFEKQRLAQSESREFVLRQEQLRSAGRLAAKIAHQIKNPLAIINNAAFALQRAFVNGRNSAQDQLEIIREEVERSDRILTKLVGYAQLAEGKVEKLEFVQELDRAIEEVFPAGVGYQVVIEKDYAPVLPSLLMQRNHLSEILVNILLNAREAVCGEGHVRVKAQPGADNSIMLTISDDGPGIPSERLEKIFEPYFTTKERGTGLGLAIVRQNVEIYGGTVQVESELGKGARFVVKLPTRTFMKLPK